MLNKGEFVNGREVTLDVLPGYEVELYQYKDSVRATSDSLELARGLPAMTQDSVLCELGSAHGPVVLCVAASSEVGKIYAIERQPDLVRLLCQNIARHRLEERVTVVEGDLREPGILCANSSDVVLLNPPYYRVGGGLECRDELKRNASFEHHGGLGDFVRGAAYVAKPGGIVKAVIPPIRLVEFVVATVECGLKIETLEPVYDRGSDEARLVNIWCRKGKGKELRIVRR